MIVADASVLVEMVRGSAAGLAAVTRIAGAGHSLHAPHLADAEVVHVLRRLVRRGVLAAGDGQRAVRALAVMPVRRYSHVPLLDRVWALRDNVTAYDAIYVALAERLGATLLTRDARLAAAPGVRAVVEVV